MPIKLSLLPVGTYYKQHFRWLLITNLVSLAIAGVFVLLLTRFITVHPWLFQTLLFLWLIGWHIFINWLSFTIQNRILLARPYAHPPRRLWLSWSSLQATLYFILLHIISYSTQLISYQQRWWALGLLWCAFIAWIMLLCISFTFWLIYLHTPASWYRTIAHSYRIMTYFGPLYVLLLIIILSTSLISLTLVPWILLGPSWLLLLIQHRLSTKLYTTETIAS